MIEPTVVQYVGWNVDKFRMHGYGAGVEGVVHMPGPKGVYSPAAAHRYRTAADGTATWTQVNDDGTVDGALEVDLSPMGPGGISAVHDRFCRAWDKKRPGQLQYWTPEFGWWWRRVRLVSFDFAGYDPAKDGTQLGVEYVADSYFYESFPEQSQYRAPTSSATQFVSGFIPLRNPGSADAYARFVLPGPGQWRIADEGATDGYVTFPYIGPNESILVNTSKNKPTVKSTSGRNLWAQTSGRFTQAVAPTIGDDVEQREIGVRNGTAGQIASAFVTPRREFPW